ncbi:MAG: ornithine cyclodeaminase family protein [Candidatus Accumulibacter phosphatis]|uniref:Ornithine cyclodeaminase n=2 Tax=Candidatus Accumulibacter TaxID=327159 RepID=A0A080M1R6_9PROT|nr:MULTISPECIES: ornithine cyclodeaminase family protein [Candidatus Accumulibacter]KFB75227.1 MAG: ornithine cyclodeaminase [Candidatus Accumulibacter cognatus]MBL8401702.1 ornithine cyclodeaminase family protein [Accumulibacter sp.]MBN8516326.1 ornithine cyclodeaminase family protein [Accumulibacter sp.]MBO3712274.1 ornithine cyclodeaminase family protein [Accumulibacter sp.]MCC2868548.1 ornithine cyclodeaminase family protein [Candidatus Accumulibacter phosphatis]
MPLFLSEKEVEELLTMPLALAAVEAAHRDLASMQACDVPRQRTRLPQTTLHILQGALPKLDVIGYKAYTSNRSGVRFLVHLYCASSGSLRAVLEADRLGMMRTGAAAGVATRWLARSDARVAGVFGAGWQAEGHLEAIAAVRSLQRVKVYARHTERLAAFCTRMSERLALEVVAVASPEEVVRGSDIVSTVTTSATPLFNAEWLAPGTHINAAGSNSLIRRELGEDVIKRCSPIVVDSVATALCEAGDLLLPLEKGRLHARQLIELGDVICGRQAGRSTPDEITLFESQGMAIQDLAVAVTLENLARERGFGVELPYGE